MIEDRRSLVGWNSESLSWRGKTDHVQCDVIFTHSISITNSNILIGVAVCGNLDLSCFWCALQV